MDGDWTTTTLGQVIELKRGYDLPTSQRQHGNVPIVSSSGVSGTHSISMVAGPGVVTGRYGTIGEVFYIDRDYWPLNTTLYVRDFKGANPRFVAYYLRQFDFETFVDKAAVPGINRNDVHRAIVQWPSRGDQDKIASLLGALDDRIDLNRRLAATLESILQALFKSWFVDFDPVHVRAEGRLTGLPDDVAALFPTNCAEDGLPVGWTVAPLSELADLQRATVNPASLGELTVDHYSLPAFDAGARPTAENASAIKSLKLALDPPLVLFSKLNPEISRVWPVLGGSGRHMLASTEFLAMKPRSGRATLAYLVNLLASESLRERAVGMVTGTSKSHQRVQPSALLQCHFIAPPAAVLSAFDKVSAPIQARIDSLRRDSSTLTNICNTLLPKLISGELRIMEAERIVGETT